MAKNAVKVRELKRKKLVEKYSAKRKELNAKGDWECLDKLKRKSSAVSLNNMSNHDSYTHLTLPTIFSV